jgi:DNA-binding transcriptional LysR family regulator
MAIPIRKRRSCRRVKGNLTLNDDEALWQATLGGLGIALLPTFIVGNDLQSGRLQAVSSPERPAADASRASPRRAEALARRAGWHNRGMSFAEPPPCRCASRTTR